MENRPNYYSILPANVRYDETLPPNAKLLYSEITALTNAEGYCWATNKYFADLYKVNKNTISLWIKMLAEKGYISTEIIYREGTKEILNRYLRLIGEGIQENRDTPIQDIRDTPITKKLKGNNTSINTTSNNTKLNNIKEQKKSVPNPDYEAEFETLWAMYPKKKNKKDAFASYIKARKTKKYTYETIKFGLERYIEHLEHEGTEAKYILNGSTFFNQERFNDEYNVVGLKRKPKSPLEAWNREFGGMDYEPKRDGEIIDYYADRLQEPF